MYKIAKQVRTELNYIGTTVCIGLVLVLAAVGLVLALTVQLLTWHNEWKKLREQKPTSAFTTQVPISSTATTATTSILATTNGVIWDIGPQCSLDDTHCDSAPPKNHPPLTIKVGRLRFRLHFRHAKDMYGDYGISQYEQERIFLSVDQPLESLQDTLWHELAHMAIRCGNHRDGIDGGTEDEFIESVVPTQLQILNDNPGLRKWMGW